MIRKTEKVHVWTIEWSHGHYKPPPDGFPKVLARQCVKMPNGSGGRIPKELELLWYAKRPPRGFNICFSSVSSEEKRTLSQESRAKIRKGNLRRRLQEKVPLFADELEQRELTANPEYFTGSRPEEQEQAIKEDAERRRIDWKMADIDAGLLILHQWWQEETDAA